MSKWICIAIKDKDWFTHMGLSPCACRHPDGAPTMQRASVNKVHRCRGNGTVALWTRGSGALSRDGIVCLVPSKCRQIVWRA